MTQFVPIVLVVVVFTAIMGCLAWATTRRMGRRAGGSVAGPFEEIWHPAAHRARIDIEQHDERTIEKPAPGDPPDLRGIRGINGGSPPGGE